MATAPILARNLMAALADQPPAVIADLTAVRYLASAGLHAWHRCADEAGHAAVAFCLVSDQRVVLRPLQLSALDRDLTVLPTLADARVWLTTQR